MSKNTYRWCAASVAALAMSVGCTADEADTELLGGDPDLPAGTVARPTTFFIADVDAGNVEVTGSCSFSLTKSGDLKWKMSVSAHPFASGWFMIYDETNGAPAYFVDIVGPKAQRSGNQLIPAASVEGLSGHELRCQIWETNPFIVWASAETTFVVP